MAPKQTLARCPRPSGPAPVATALAVLLLVSLSLHRATQAGRGPDSAQEKVSASDAAPALARETWLRRLQQPAADNGASPRPSAVSVSYGVLAGVEAAWAFPNVVDMVGDDRGHRRLLLLFHGCTHGAASFFRFGEHRLFTRTALELGWAVLALSSADRAVSRCWEGTYPPERNADVGRVLAAVRQFQKEHPAPHWSLAAAGASSGGTFVSILAHDSRLTLAAMAVYISAGSKAAWADVHCGRPPPTAFVYMPRDHNMASNITVGAAVAAIQRRAGQTTVFPCHPRPMTPTTLAKMLPLSLEASTLAFELLLSDGALDDEGYLKEDGRRLSLPWRDAAAREKASIVHELNAWSEEVEEVLNAHFAFHEMTSDHAGAVLAWLTQAAASARPT